MTNETIQIHLQQMGQITSLLLPITTEEEDWEDDMDSDPYDDPYAPNIPSYRHGE